MTTEKIEICGKEVTLAYCYATEIGFQQYTDAGMEHLNTSDPTHILYLILAASIPYYKSRGEEPPLAAEDLMYNTNPEELVAAVAAIMRLRAEWYKIPLGEPKDEPQEGADEKNV